MDIFFLSQYPRRRVVFPQSQRRSASIGWHRASLCFAGRLIEEQVEYTAVRKKVVTFVLQTRIVLESQSTHGHIFFCLKYIPKTRVVFLQGQRGSASSGYHRASLCFAGRLIARASRIYCGQKKVVTFVLQTRIVLESQSTHGHIFFCLKYIPKTQSGFPTLD